MSDRTAALIFLLYCAFLFTSLEGCSETYQRKFCSMSLRQRREERIRMEALRSAIAKISETEKELTECYASLANIPRFAAELKLMAFATAGKDFRLLSYYEFNHIRHPANFLGAIEQLAEKENAAFLVVELSMEQISFSTSQLIRKYNDFVTQSDNDDMLKWKHLLHGDINRFEKEGIAAIASAESDLVKGMAMLVEIKNSFEENSYSNLPSEQRTRLLQLLRAHKAGYDSNIKLLQTVQNWIFKVTKVLRNITTECNAEAIRKIRDKECTVRHAQAANIMQSAKELTNDYDRVSETYVKNFYKNSPIMMVIAADRDSLIKRQKMADQRSQNASLALKKRFDEKLSKRAQRLSQKMSDTTCYAKLSVKKDLKEVCKRLDLEG